jgi:ribosomal protein S25
MSKETDHFVEEVSHWVHDEQACVTVQRIVQTFHLSWSVALSILKEIPKHGSDYSVTFYGLETSDAASSGVSAEGK